MKNLKIRKTCFGLILLGLAMTISSHVQAQEVVVEETAQVEGNEIEVALGNIIDIAKSLEDSVGPKEIFKLRSIEALARNARAMVRGNGDHSVSALSNCQALIRKIRAYDEFIAAGYSIANTADSIEDLDTNLYALKRALD